jgi:anti-sigma factor RsiW
MSDCRGRLEAVSALVDGELAPEEELELRRHLEACEACGAWRRQLEALSAGLASSLGRERAPRALAWQVERLAPRRRRRRALAAALAGTTAAATALWLLLPRDELAAELLLDDHRDLVSGRTALAVPSSDPSEVARDLAGRLPFRIEVAPVPGAELRGGHACTLKGLRAAYLQYLRRGEAVSVFVIPGSVSTGAGLDRCAQIEGANLCAFAGAHETLAVVASSAEVAQAFRASAHVVERP